MRKPKVSIALNSEILDKIDTIKIKYKIETSGYRESIRKMCEILLEKNESKRQELEQLKSVIDKIFYFLQEKVNEEKFLQEEFFKELIRLYAAIIERLRG